MYIFKYILFNMFLDFGIFVFFIFFDIFSMQILCFFFFFENCKMYKYNW